MDSNPVYSSTPPTPPPPPPPPPPPAKTPAPAGAPLPPAPVKTSSVVAKPLAPSPSSKIKAAPPPRVGGGRKASRFLLFLGIGLVLVGTVAGAVALFSRLSQSFSSGKLVYWGLWEPEEVMGPILSEFEASHPGIKVEYVMQSPQEYRERLQTALDEGKGPDLFRIHNTWVPLLRSNLDPLPSSVYSVSDYKNIFYPTTARDFQVGNDYVAVPLEFDGLAMFVNDTMFQNAGMSIPQNWEELRDAARILSQCESEDGSCTPSDSRIITSGVALGTTDNVDHWQDIVAVLMLQNNVDLNHPYTPDPKPAQDVIDYFNSFSRTLRIWDSNLPSSTNQFAAGKLAIYFAPSWRVFDIKTANPGLRFSVHPIPQLPVDIARGETPINWASYWAEAVNTKSPNKKQAWELIKYLSSSDTLVRFYQSAVQSPRAFGEPYSRTDLADILKNEPLVGAYVNQAPLARSWYLASSTHDGPSGINSRVSSAFSETIIGESDLQALEKEIGSILSDYGIQASP